MIRTRLLPLGLFLCCAPLLWAVQQDTDLEALLRDRAAKAEQLATPEVWLEATALRRLAQESAGDDFDLALGALLGKAGELGPKGVLLLVATRMETESPDYQLLAEVLLPHVEAGTDEVVEGAAGLLCDSGYNQVDEETLEALTEHLVAGARSSERSPQARLELATAAYLRGDGKARRAARGEMLAFLESSDPLLRGMAALALGRIGDLETSRTELEQLALLPGPDGRLAAAYLKLERQKNYWDGKNRGLRARLQERLDQGGSGEGAERVDKLIDLIVQMHVEGDVVDPDDLVSAALDGMLRSLDRHSSYLDAETYADFAQDLSAEYGGIGAYVAVDRDDNIFTITRPIYSGPAYKAKLRSEDKIVRINDWPTLENGLSKPTDDIIKRLKGKPGTPVRLYIWRRGMDPQLIERPTEDMVVEVERAQITIPPVQVQMLPGDVGLIELIQFTGVASQEVRRGLEGLLEAGARAIVFDLRSNPGGLLDEARAVGDLFLPKEQLVVSTESRIRPTERLYTKRPPVVPDDVPVVVLVNRYSASASEIVSGALQDHKRAVVVGQRSFGKGSVQNLVRMPGEHDDIYEDANGNRRHDNWEELEEDRDGDGEFDFAPRVKLTIARYLLPSGRSIHRELDEEGNIVEPGGVEPDEIVSQKRWEGWKLEEMVELQKDRKIREWVAGNWDEHADLFRELAVSDGRDASRYPGLLAFHESLDTMLPLDDLRFLVRREVRRIVQDDRGAAFPQGDFQEDRQLQKGIAVALEALGGSFHDVPAYDVTFELDEEGQVPEVPTLTARSELDSELEAARDLLTGARDEEGRLSKADVDRLAEILSRLDR